MLAMDLYIPDDDGEVTGNMRRGWVGEVRGDRVQIFYLDGNEVTSEWVPIDDQDPGEFAS
jgi:hypothetical protein